MEALRMRYRCLTLKDLLDEFDKAYWQHQEFDSTKPYSRFIDEYVKEIQDCAIVLEEPETTDELDELNKKRLYKDITEWLHDEEPVYNAKCEIIEEMSAGEAKTESRFNDTPQSQGNYSAETYTSTITTSKTSGTISSAEKKKLLENVRMGAVREFSRRFVIYEGGF